MIPPRIWAGDTAVCVGSGPSLTAEDVASCRGLSRVIAINESYRMAPFADVLYACDHDFWKWNDGVPSFHGLKYSIDARPKRGQWADVQILPREGGPIDLAPKRLGAGNNGGYQAIVLAAWLGASRILLLGYDMHVAPNGDQHWHGPHPNSRRSPYREFQRAFPELVQPLRQMGVTVINCSRRTALTCFPTMPITEALGHAVAA